ncbi:type III secretion system chaperone [Pseudomonas sp. SDO528_S397]
MNPSPRPPAKTPLSEDASAWLAEAANDLGLPADQAREFARSGALSLPGMSVQLSLWQAEPVQQWIALGLLPRPATLAADPWSELLLRANCAVSAMSTGSVALNETGDGLLVQRLASRPGQVTTRLGNEVAHLLALAESLVGGATALSGGATGPAAPGHTAPVQQRGAQAAATAAMNQHWHRPLLTQALQHLGIAVPPAAQMQTVGVIQVNARSFEVLADADGQHLLVSSAIKTPLTRGQQRERALQANLHLMLLSQCAVVLTPTGSALQARWNSQALDGAAFADWLLDFGHLADSFTQAPAPAPSALRNRTWT